MIEPVLDHVVDGLRSFAIAVAVPLPFFLLLAIAVKRRRLLGDVMRALPECRLNLLMHFVDALLVAPILLALTIAMEKAFDSYRLTIVPAGVWDGLHPVVIGAAAVFLGDFAGYWRHRIEHTPLLWPSHAVHHSDTEMTWLAIFRFHPINRLTTTIIDSAFILSMGLPAYAVLVSALFRHYYGAFIHADLPWTFGPLRHVFVSPAMHRWHHSADAKAYNTNYAVVFSLFDHLFGTFRVPGVCTTALGVPENMGKGLVGQLAHPLRPSSYRYFIQSLARWRRRWA